MTSELAQHLLDWYDKNARQMPWRGAKDPYAIWISEIMLQQTQVDTVTPYFQRWMTRFPKLADLASASEQDVLQMWEGLGYYSRARSMLKTAQKVMQEYGGRLPSDRQLLEKLPGIGPYTSGAIASIAFNLDEATLDGNIRRVLSRLFDVALPARSKQGEIRLWNLARQILPAGRAGDFNQALMDLGATICIPRSPLCLLCPLNADCEAYHLGVQEERPVNKLRPPIPHYNVVAAIIEDPTGRVLIAQRPTSGLLGGMWEFPGGKLEEGEEMSAGLSREIREELAAAIEVGAAFGVYRHAYTHFKVTLYAFFCRLIDGSIPQPLEASDLRWVFRNELGQFPMGKIDRQISNRLEGA
jgi:A/G-specific adenine glycosylase